MNKENIVQPKPDTLSVFVSGIEESKLVFVPPQLITLPEPYQSIRKDVYNLNRYFGNEMYSGLRQPLLKQISLVVEETKEILEAIKTKNWVELADGIGDFWTVYFGLGYTSALFEEKDSGGYIYVNEHPNKGVILETMHKLVDHVEVILSKKEEHSSAEIYQLFFLMGYLRDGVIRIQELFVDMNVLEIYNEVHCSNMSKFIDGPDCEAATLEKYVNMGVDPNNLTFREVGEGLKVVVVAETFTLDGKAYPAGKVLKGANFKEPKFETKFIRSKVYPYEERLTVVRA